MDTNIYVDRRRRVLFFSISDDNLLVGLAYSEGDAGKLQYQG